MISAPPWSPDPMSSTSTQPMLRMRGITKRFPGTLALDTVDFDADGGTIHRLLGENGAGKSTLLKILAGDYQASEGRSRSTARPRRSRARERRARSASGSCTRK